jgi:hypothetical protein
MEDFFKGKSGQFFTPAISSVLQSKWWA